MASPYPWHYTLRWPVYYNWPSVRNHSKLQSAPDQYQFSQAEADDIRLLFCGDIMVQHADRTPWLHPALCNLISSADLFIGNCEAPVGDHQINADSKYRFIFYMPREYLTGIIEQTGLPPKKWLLSMANNHTGDIDYQACLRSDQILRDIGVTPLGRYKQDHLPLHCIDINHQQLGFIAWTHWMNRDIFPAQDPGAYRYQHIIEYDWHHLKKRNNIHYLFGFPHWEFEFQHFPSQTTRSQAMYLVEKSGIDFLVGAHTHTLQPIEWFKQGVCAYNLGNFCGLGHAWPIKLISLLEVNIRSKKSSQMLVSYKLHYFFQQHLGKQVNIIPLTDAPTQIKNRLEKRIARIFHKN